MNVEQTYLSARELLEKYLPIYFDWLAKKLENTSPFITLSFAVGIFVALMIYVWFRNRD